MKLRVNDKHLPVLATLLVCAGLYAVGSVAYYGSNFFSLAVLEQLFSNKSELGIIAVGMTFVILSGGIDLSVGSVFALSTMIVAMLVARAHWNPLAAMAVALAAGAAVGLLNGTLIQVFSLPPFLVTLATLFLPRGIALVMNHSQRIALDSSEFPFFGAYTNLGVTVAGQMIHLRAIVFVGVVVVAVIVARTTRFGRNVYALGGGEHAAGLMGLPVGRTKVLVYVMSGFLAALAGVVMLGDSPAGDPTIAIGWELDAIAAVVIGGTLLSGGVGYVFGTLLGVLILALIEQLINFDGRLDPSWARVVNGLLLFLFVALQKLLTTLKPGKHVAGPLALGGLLRKRTAPASV